MMLENMASNLLFLPIPSSVISDMMLENMASNQKRWKSQMEAEEALEERENCEPNLDLQKLRNSHLRRRHRW